MSRAKFGVLTNGIIYRFCTDLAEPNTMDEKPFLEVNLLELKDAQTKELKKFHRSYFDIENILSSALESNHLAICFEEEGGNVEIVCLTDYGKLYLESNPRLCNPVDWKWIITTTITTIASSIALFVACKALNQ